MSRVLPILFNTEMVQSILDGRKTVTRRVIKRQIDVCPSCKHMNVDYIYDEIAQNIYCASCGNPFDPVQKPPYQLGDILYVRETWTYHEGAINGIIYKARCPGKLAKVKKWRPSIHMPKEAARIWLKVTDVRVERLQEISEYQIIAEGTPYDKENYAQWKRGDVITHNAETYLRKCYRDLWNSAIKKSDLDRYGWAANPWVWVIEFERCGKPD